MKKLLKKILGKKETEEKKPLAKKKSPSKPKAKKTTKKETIAIGSTSKPVAIDITYEPVKLTRVKANKKPTTKQNNIKKAIEETEYITKKQYSEYTKLLRNKIKL